MDLFSLDFFLDASPVIDEGMQVHSGQEIITAVNMLPSPLSMTLPSDGGMNLSCITQDVLTEPAVSQESFPVMSGNILELENQVTEKGRFLFLPPPESLSQMQKGNESHSFIQASSENSAPCLPQHQVHSSPDVKSGKRNK